MNLNGRLSKLEIAIKPKRKDELEVDLSEFTIDELRALLIIINSEEEQTKEAQELLARLYSKTKWGNIRISY
jgi:hypothetical protein